MHAFHHTLMMGITYINMAVMKKIKGHWPDFFKNDLVETDHIAINGNRKVIDLVPGFSFNRDIGIIHSKIDRNFSQCSFCSDFRICFLSEMMNIKSDQEILSFRTADHGRHLFGHKPGVHRIPVCHVPAWIIG